MILFNHKKNRKSTEKIKVFDIIKKKELENLVLMRYCVFLCFSAKARASSRIAAMIDKKCSVSSFEKWE